MYGADVWALGVTLYCMLFSRLPFAGTTLVEMARSVTDDECVHTHTRAQRYRHPHVPLTSMPVVCAQAVVHGVGWAAARVGGSCGPGARAVDKGPRGSIDHRSGKGARCWSARWCIHKPGVRHWRHLCGVCVYTRQKHPWVTAEGSLKVWGVSQAPLLVTSDELAKPVTPVKSLEVLVSAAALVLALCDTEARCSRSIP